MTTVLKYIFNASISQGPSKSIKEEIQMNTYDIVSIKVESGKEEKISFLPNSSAGIEFFIITSDIYSPKGITNPNKILQYIIKSKTTPIKDISIILDIPHVLIGKSMIDKIGNFSELTIKNGLEPDINASIWAGRVVGEDN
jgi:hypothetical protein